MKALAINGGPRRGWNTDALLLEALRGAQEAGTETEMIRLYDLKYTGCRSCMACKRKGAVPCRCYWKDDLSPALEKVLQADVLFLGSPVYLGTVTAQTHAFLERLHYILFSYNDMTKSLFTGRVDSACFFTMNAPRDYYRQNMKASLETDVAALKGLNGSLETYACCDTLQVGDYSKYELSLFDPVHKKRIHEEQFPKDLQAAYEIGKRLAAR